MSAANKPGPPPKLSQGNSLSAASPNGQVLLREKLNRRSTPDSEALASSDEEPDSQRQDLPPPPTSAAAATTAPVSASATAGTGVASQPPKPAPARRPSWLNDTSQGVVRPRNESFASSSMSPTTSYPNTPLAAENGAAAGTSTATGWNTHAAPPNPGLTRAHTASAAFSWGSSNGIWNSDRKDPPARLSEVLPSPTSGMPPGTTGGFYSPESLPSQTSPAPRGDQGSGSAYQIPFVIPPHPTPKAYRSQSYSVGQLDPETALAAATAAAVSAAAASSLLGGAGRVRPMGHTGLQHRPSRPSMLSEMSNDGTMLGKVKEVDDDDDDSINESLQSSQHLSAEAKKIEMLTRENALLRQQQAASQQYHNARIRPRASTSVAYGLGNGYSSLQETVPEESDYAIDELDETNDTDLLGTSKRAPRRMSEFAAAGAFRSPFAVENRKLENVKKAFWQSTPGFADISPSRRHSFADIPIRQASIGSINEVVLAHEVAAAAAAQDTQSAGTLDYAAAYGDSHSFSAKAAAVAAQQSFYGAGSNTSTAGVVGAQAQQLSLAGSGGASGGYPSPYGLHTPPFSTRPTSPQRSMYGIAQPNRQTPLHIVLFKCARADVFYIQEGTGLTVKPGDLVIVEADRGTDLGTVAVVNVDWVEARRLKEHYAEEQYKWLMMYSQNAAAAQDGVGAGLMASSTTTTGLQGSGMGGMGSMGGMGGMGAAGQHHMQEPSVGELKPKLIKRLAQNHEIHALRDKEGNEAKAKRVCMQKVKEHSLNMEILDAEFQMDWKKLTFYYFADAYINFNSLVTDLFKIYKTRIWMSAINPASFATQLLGLQAPSGIGPGAVGVGRGTSSSDRRTGQHGDHSQQHQQQQQLQQQQQQHQQQQLQLHQQHQIQQQAQQHQAQAYSSTPPPGRGFVGAVGSQASAGAGLTSGSYQQSFLYAQPYAGFGSVPRAPGNVAYGQGIAPAAASDAFLMGGYPTAADYAAVRGRFPTGQTDGSQPGQGGSPLVTSNDWISPFQGLSLNTR